MWQSVIDEAREVLWVVSLVGGLSAAAVGLGIVLAAG
jgi:hypothetical protein